MGKISLFLKPWHPKFKPNGFDFMTYLWNSSMNQFLKLWVTPWAPLWAFPT